MNDIFIEIGPKLLSLLKRQYFFKINLAYQRSLISLIYFLSDILAGPSDSF